MDMSVLQPRIRVVLHQGESVINQCAHAALNQGRNLAWFTAFMARTKQCHDPDSLLGLLFEEFDIVSAKAE